MNFDQQEYSAAKFSDFVSYKCTQCREFVPRLKRDIATEIRLDRSGFRCHLCRQHPSPIQIRECAFCHKEFEPTSNVQKFCNSSCSAKFNNPKRTRVLKLRKSRRQRYWSKDRPHHCGNPKCSNSALKAYCSTSCAHEYRKRLYFSKLLRNENPSTDVNTIARGLKRYLVYKHGPKCFKCEWSQINPFTNRVPIEINHIDGNCANNDLKNLELVCPNCHSLTQHHKGANKTYNGENPRYQQWKAAHERRSQQSSNMPS